MKILVISRFLKEKHKEKILKAADEIGGRVLFAGSEDDITIEFEDCEVIYGFGMDND